MSGNNPINPWAPYSNDFIDVTDPAVQEFYETFGAAQAPNLAPPTAALSFRGRNLPPQIFPREHVSPSIQQVTYGLSTLSLGEGAPSMAPPATHNEFSLAAHAAILGVTEEELAQMLALAPDVSEQEIAQILTNAPQLVQDPDLYFPEEEHIWGNLPYTPAHAPTSLATVDPAHIMLPPYVAPYAAPDVSNNQPGPSFQPQQAPMPVAETLEQPLSERAKRAQRRALLRELAEKSRIRK